MNDTGAPDIHLWHWIEQTAAAMAKTAGYYELRTPLVEPTTLFTRGVGETTDMVEKEMYTFKDRGDESISLRPEGTASVVRAALEHNWLAQNAILKVYYSGPMFRYERPQKGRLRQFFQFGCELFGIEGPRADVEIIALQHFLFQKLGISDVELRVSSIGDNVCRPPFREKLVAQLQSHRAELCGDCQRRMEKNPLRVFDCKNPNCQKIAATLPTMLDHLCEPCRLHFDGVKAGLEALKVPFTVDPRIVRGIDYYTRTAFEFVSKNIGAQGTISGGGRYDNLVGELGGPATPAVGFAMGIERLALLLESKKAELNPGIDVFFVTPDPEARAITEPLAYHLRLKGVSCEVDLQDKAMKNQLKRADKVGARFCVIIGGNEIQQGIATMKDMKAGKQVTVPLKDLELAIAASVFPEGVNEQIEEYRKTLWSKGS